MPVEYIKGNVFDGFVGDCILVHGCNSQHAFGAGVAGQIRNRYPKAFRDYINKETLTLGEVIFSRIDKTRFIANAITQNTFGSTGVHADVVAIEFCLNTVCRFAKAYQTKYKTTIGIIMPEIGCGLGGLTTDIVFPVIEKVFDKTNCKVFSL